MLGSLAKAWSAVKEGAFESGAKLYLNQKIGSFGNVEEVRCDKAKRTMYIRATLKGEPTPISVEVASYDVSERQGETYVTVRQVAGSREWSSLALQQYVIGREFKVPSS